MVCEEGLGMRLKRQSSLLVLLVVSFAGEHSSVFGWDFAKDIRPLLEKHCWDCHGDEAEPVGGVNLAKFQSEAEVLQDRQGWQAVYQKLESQQMPPPKESLQPLAEERQRILAWIEAMAAKPDPKLGMRDPGKPVLRRLTRLEYNNTVRDLLGLEIDIFAFPERLPFVDKDYFQPASGQMGQALEVRLREYGARYPVLLPQAGLAGDHRAEHGFRNRGDAMNFSPLLFEQYAGLAREIAEHPDLPRRSRIFAELLGVDFEPYPAASVNSKKELPGGSLLSPCVARFVAARDKVPLKAEGSADNAPSQFREDIAEAFAEGRGGVCDLHASMANTTLPGKGGLLRVPYGDAGSKTLTINPDADLWIAAFATAEPVSGKLLLANRMRQEKRYTLTFRLEDAATEERITRLAICVLGRKGQSGPVFLTASYTDGSSLQLTATITEGSAGTTFFSFAAAPGAGLKTLAIDGSQFSGDYVLVDDLAFITSAAPMVGPRPYQFEVGSPPEPTLAASSTAGMPKAGVARQATLPATDRLRAFLGRAFRRPATDEEVQRFQQVLTAGLQAGKSEGEAMRAVVQSVLSSPSFLFLAEAARGKEPVRPLDDYELASRLSYFLWSSMPDEELLAAAGRGELQTQPGLKTQALRLLRDPRARELSESFAAQWLRLDQLYVSKPDRELFQDFYAGPQGKETLHGTALLEALLLFETVMVEDRSVLDFIDADYTWLNPRLAKLYRLSLNGPGAAEEAGSHGPATTRELSKADKDANHRWQRVPLNDRQRGGFLTMAGPLTITSLPFRTSPVKRGAWLLETIFNRPPQEPKVAFAVTNDTKDAVQHQSIRQRFEQHRNQAACYSCHVRLDPPGFALERFDPIGRWREFDGGQPIDASGAWQGLAFEGPAEFKTILAERPDEFLRGLIEHLLSYALGRPIAIDDMPAIAAIQQAAAGEDYRFQNLIAAIVESYPFRMVRQAR
jgi:hypothetical protein